MEKYPQIITGRTTMNKPFTFAEKVRVGEYVVYDFNSYIGLYGKSKRVFPQSSDKDKKNVDLFVELTEVLGFKVRRVNDLTVEFVHPDFEAYEDVTVPLYTKGKNGINPVFSYVGTTYTIKGVPTKESVEKAWEYKIMIERTIKEQLLVSEVEDAIDGSLDKVSCVFVNEKDVSKLLDEEEYLTFYIQKPRDDVSDYRDYRMLIINKRLAKEYAENGFLKITVPKAVAGLVIGKGGANVKELSKKLDLKGIKVIPVE